MGQTSLLVWHPDFSVDSFAEADPMSDWPAWQKYLSGREQVTLWEPGKLHPLLYSVPETWYQSNCLLCRHTRVAKITARAGLAAEFQQLVESWQASTKADQSFHDLQALDLAYVLPWASRFLEPELWWRTTEALYRLAQGSVETASQADQPLAQQWLAAELPLVLGLQFPEFSLSELLADQAYDVLHRGFEQWLDGEGLPAAAHYESTRLLLACWMRCRQLLKWHPTLDWTREGETHLTWLLRRAAELTRGDGTAILSTTPTVLDADLFYDTLNETTLLDLVIPSARLWENTQSTLVPETIEPNTNEPANHSEWSEIGWLRSSWRPTDPIWFVRYDRPQLDVELNTYGHTWFQGEWSAKLEVTGTSLELDSWYDWEHQLWLNDEDVSYLELQRNITPELIFQRQMMLARKDRFLLLMECVLGAQEQTLQLQSVLPLAPTVEVISMERSNERLLLHGKRLLRVVPLSLSEWQTEQRVGEIRPTSEGLQLQQRSSGPGLCAAWWIDLDSRRANRFVTWRRLTVAENRSVLTPGQAVGYRLQVGKKQWVFYRSLQAVANRTFLGINLTTQFFAGRFLRTGTTETLLEVE